MDTNTVDKFKSVTVATTTVGVPSDRIRSVDLVHWPGVVAVRNDDDSESFIYPDGRVVVRYKMGKNFGYYQLNGSTDECSEKKEKVTTQPWYCQPIDECSEKKEKVTLRHFNFERIPQKKFQKRLAPTQRRLNQPANKST